MSVAALLVVLVCAPLLQVATMALAHVALGQRPQLVSFGLGPALFERELRGTKVRLSAFPLGGFVQMPDGADGRPIPIPPLRRALILLAGPLLVLVLALLLGADPRSITRALPQIVSGPWAPFEVGAPLVRAWLAHAAIDPTHAVAALLLRLALYNLLPVPGLGGFDIIESIGLAALRRTTTARPEWLTGLGALVVVPMALGWLVAIGAALL